MRKLLALAGFLAALAIPAVGISADLHSAHIGSECKSEDLRVWHFVNNQTDGATGGTLTARFDLTGDGDSNDPGEIITNSNPTHVNKNVLQWDIFLSGDVTLLGATSTSGGVSIPGRLVLSDFCKK
jgi:hypothetical protein